MIMKYLYGIKGVLALVVASTTISSCRNPLSLPTADPATILLFDDFDTENNGVGALNWSGFKNWVVTQGCVDLHGNGFYDVQPGRGLYVDLDGTCKAAGTIQTRLALNLLPGDYTLEFWLAGNQRRNTDDAVTISLGDVFTERIVLARRERFTLYTRKITVTQPTTAKLVFAGSGGDDEGILLDLVRLRRNP